MSGWSLNAWGFLYLSKDGSKIHSDVGLKLEYMMVFVFVEGWFLWSHINLISANRRELICSACGTGQEGRIKDVVNDEDCSLYSWRGYTTVQGVIREFVALSKDIDSSLRSCSRRSDPGGGIQVMCNWSTEHRVPNYLQRVICTTEQVNVRPAIAASIVAVPKVDRAVGSSL